VLEGPMTGDAFRVYVEKALAAFTRSTVDKARIR
jgi:hypothetical protein